MRIETVWFAALLTLLGGMLLYAFAPGELATLRRWWRAWRLHRRVRQYAAAWHRDGTDLLFGFAQLARTRPDRRIRTLPRHRLAGGAR